MKDRWYCKTLTQGQALVINETTGRNVAVVYEATDAPILAAAPELLDALVVARQYVEALNGAMFDRDQQIAAAKQVREAIATAKKETP